MRLLSMTPGIATAPLIMLLMAQGKTALLIACKAGAFRVVEILLLYGADLSSISLETWFRV